MSSANSLVFASASSQSLSRTLGAGNQQKFTFAAWIKLTSTTTRYGFMTQRAVTPGIDIEISDFANGAISVVSSGDGSSFLFLASTLISDTNWHHLCVAVDTTQTSSAAARCHI